MPKIAGTLGVGVIDHDLTVGEIACGKDLSSEKGILVRADNEPTAERLRM